MPAAVVMHAGSEQARSWTGSLGTLAESLAAGLASPAVILVGGVVGDTLQAVQAMVPGAGALAA
ncbi:hypothetical protein D9M72_355380 [compost metagenome]